MIDLIGKGEVYLKGLWKKILVGAGIILTITILPGFAEAATSRYTVRQGDTIFKIGQRLNISSQEIIRINRLKNASLIYPGQTILLPDSNSAASRSGSQRISKQDLRLLAQAVYGEARGESYTGQVAVAAVVLNRVQSPEFPNSISRVVFQPGAFTAVHDGQFYLEPNATALRAAREAVNGSDPTNGALYYWNPAKATNTWIWSRPVTLSIGKHVFAK